MKGDHAESTNGLSTESSIARRRVVDV